MSFLASFGREYDLRKADIAALTGLRGFAALYVVLYHYEAGLQQPGILGRIICHGYISVDMFFILSGFVMALSYGELFRLGGGMRSYGIFLVRRLARVYPLYAVVTVVLFVTTLLDLTSHPLPSDAWRLLWTNTLLVQAWGIGPSINLPAWSISTEWAAYLVFPLLAAAVMFSRVQLSALCILVALAGVVWVASSPDTHGVDIRYGPLDVFSDDNLYPLLRCLFEFTLGLACFRFEPAVAKLPSRIKNGLALGVSAAIACLLAVSTSDIVLVPLFAGLIMLLASSDGWVARFFGSRVAVWLGMVSYAVYLLHMHLYRVRMTIEEAAQDWVPDGIAHIIGLALGYGILLAGALVAYVTIERPGRQILRRAERMFAKRPAALVASSSAFGLQHAGALNAAAKLQDLPPAP